MESRSWGEAQAFCASLESGWRLPTIEEMETVTLLNDYHREYGGIYWTSNPCNDFEGHAWVYDTSEREALIYDTEEEFSVLVMRKKR